MLSEDAIRDHIADYKDSKKLKPKSSGSVEKLSVKQSKQLEEHLRQHTYLYLKDIAAYVLAVWNISYTVPGLLSWLKRHKLSYKKPAIVRGKGGKQQQEAWGP